MKRAVKVLVICAGLALASAGGARSVLAGGHGEGRCGCMERMEGGHGGHFQEMAQQLGLTARQQEELKGAFEQGRAEARPLRENLREARRQLGALVHSGSADDSAVRAQSAKVGAIETELALLRARHARAFLSALTPEQGAKWKELQAQRMERSGTGGHHTGRGVGCCDGR